MKNFLFLACMLLFANNAKAEDVRLYPYLFPAHHDADLLFLAIKKGDSEEAKRQIELGVDVNAWDDYGDTPLHWAASQGQHGVVEALLNHGVDINAQDYDGYTPVDIALSNSRHGMAEILIKKGGKRGSEL